MTTPMIGRDEIDRESTSLWPVHVGVWEGFVFVNLSREEPEPLLHALADQEDDALGLARVGLSELRIGHISTVDVAANWRIVLQNYNECLHCPTVHPELMAVVPAYRKGSVAEAGRDDGGASLADGRTAVALDPRLRLPLLPGLKGQTGPFAYFGAAAYPTMFLDVDGSAALATAISPTGPRSCRLVTEYLFNPEAFDGDEFDPRPIIDFNELVTRRTTRPASACNAV